MMRGLILQRRSQSLGRASTGLVNRLVSEVMLVVDAEVSRMLMLPSNALLDPSTATATNPHHASTSPSSTTFNFCSDGGVRELSTTVNVQKQQERMMEDGEEYEDTQPGRRAQFEKVKQVPQTTKQQWWRPDPETGIWIPEEHKGQVTTSTAATKSPSRIVTRIRAETTSLDDKKWWTSMEELPDMDRAEPKT